MIRRADVVGVMAALMMGDHRPPTREEDEEFMTSYVAAADALLRISEQRERKARGLAPTHTLVDDEPLED